MYTKKFGHSIGTGEHEVERNLSIIKEFGAISKRRPELFPSEEDFDIANQIMNPPFYCMAPASVWFTKQLPIEKWIELIDYYNELINFDIKVDIYDPWVDPNEIKHEYNIDVFSELPNGQYAAVILAVAHKEFLDLDVRSFAPTGVVYDVKGILPKEIVDSRL